jgi:hypothetical protein
MPVKINCETEQGGAVQLNAKHKVWASFAIAGVADLPKLNILHAGAKLRDGRSVQFFLNLDSGLVVVDVIDKNQKGGVEIVRKTLLKDKEG